MSSRYSTGYFKHTSAIFLWFSKRRSCFQHIIYLVDLLVYATPMHTSYPGSRLSQPSDPTAGFHRRKLLKVIPVNFRIILHVSDLYKPLDGTFSYVRDTGNFTRKQANAYGNSMGILIALDWWKSGSLGPTGSGIVVSPEPQRNTRTLPIPVFSVVRPVLES